MKFSVVAFIAAAVSTVYAQAATPNAGVAVNLPGYGVSIYGFLMPCLERDADIFFFRLSSMLVLLIPSLGKSII